ncbi:UvrD-helicase domain-containing protein [Bradyrhizobium sp. A5]|uniref:UvrD-helicase domain-containing protein n=1 Tax=Bradyrhizobium sp. A5 TaxID=3133696 RepID=UPI0032510E80
MSEAVYQAIGRARAGFVEAPAGCGKTEAIVRTVGAFCDGCQLVLTHTHAGVDALRQRFRMHGVARAKYHVDTIAGWAWGWVRMYPSNAAYRGPVDIAAWGDVYSGMCNLLHKDFVQQGILNSYSGVIVDEYQDCTAQMHSVIVELKRLLPCRVLGDDLQGIFGFRDEEPIGWSDVRAEFCSDLGALETPHRWIKAGNERLGRWLLDSRDDFRAGREPSYRNAPVERRSMTYSDLSKKLIGIVRAKQGRMCVIGHKARPLPAGIETSLVSHQFRVLEPNDLSVLQELLRAICDGESVKAPKAVMTFFKRVFGALGPDDKLFFQRILSNKPQRVLRADRRDLCKKHKEGITPRLLFDLLEYVGSNPGIPCKLKESVSALQCILEAHLETGASLKTLYADEISRRKYHSRSSAYRCIGSTLLVKGLEFDHAIVLRAPDWQDGWGTHKDVYVALTRGAKSATLIDLINLS